MVNIPYSKLNLEQFFQLGTKKLDEEHAAKEALSKDNLRGGNSGCLLPDGRVVGECHRNSIARALSLELAPGESSQFFFDQGRGVESTTERKLRAGWPGTIRCEEDAASCWQTESGKKVTGRTDFLLEPGSSEIQETLGIELKSLCASGTANRLWFDKEPDIKHLCQAAHYMWQHNQPWVLLYVNNCNHEASNWNKKKVGISSFKKLVIPPFRMYFYLTIRDGVLYYKLEGKEYQTVITIDGIKQYYELVEECIRTKQLYHAPTAMAPLGKKKNYSHEEYCEYCQAAAKAGGDWDHWVDILTMMKENI